MGKKLVTIIVPVYNVEKYLERCLNSLLDQIYENIEILIIDDGSSDKSPIICENYLKNDKRIRVIHKDNGGLASARNVGIENAVGEYITFVDSDDYVTPFYVSNLVSALESGRCDLAVSMFINVLDGEEYLKDKGKPDLLNLRITDSRGCLKDMLYQKGIETSAPGKIFKKSQIRELRFPNGRLYEDIMFTTIMLSRAAKIAIIDNVDYLYYQRNGSIQYQSFSNRKMDCIRHSRDMIRFVSKRYPELKNAGYVRYFGALCNILFQIPNRGYYKEQRIIWNDILKCRRIVIADRNSRRKSKVAALLSFLGPRVMRFVYYKTQIRGLTRSDR